MAFQQENRTTISTRQLRDVCDSLFNKHWIHPWRKVFTLLPQRAVTQIHRGSCMAFANYIKASDYLLLTSAQRPDSLGIYSTAASHSLPSIHLFHPRSFPLSFSFFFLFYSPHLPSGEMVWPFWSKQALITPWEGIVQGTAQGIWRGPHRGTWDQEIDAVGVQGVMPPYGMCTAPADGVSVSPWVSVSRTVRGGGGTLALGNKRCCKLEQWADRKLFHL